MKNFANKAVLWLYKNITLQGLLLFIQILVAVGCLVCVHLGRTASTPELVNHYTEAANVHVVISWILTFAIIIIGGTKFGSTPFFPKFINVDHFGSTGSKVTYDAED